MGNRLQTVVLEARDPHALARFYSELLGLEVTRTDGDWVDIGDASTTRLSFQHAPGHRPPEWPDGASPMQMHLDIEVDDIDASEELALSLGATRLDWDSAQEEAMGLRPVGRGGFRVFTDPAGHPFCLCWN
ncbi:VOC family protein [Nocardiopsis sp. RSe5-2]|uniref:VOC family protein n=1 Tax=Nocardiopsis endophytica TaxID=3018445 RepID=A0ABT4U783_9ACTN|nr:VOC family protein [Nocardiopsis endophytica]MDA2812813.1 VOC family protein [Nocardiopsis endophytica]